MIPPRTDAHIIIQDRLALLFEADEDLAFLDLLLVEAGHEKIAIPGHLLVDSSDDAHQVILDHPQENHIGVHILIQGQSVLPFETVEDLAFLDLLLVEAGLEKIAIPGHLVDISDDVRQVILAHLKSNHVGVNLKIQGRIVKTFRLSVN